MLKGALLADLIPTFDFINMIGGECDGDAATASGRSSARRATRSAA
jgi:hypothetical protein